MTQNHIIIIFLIQALLFYLAIYSINIANRWVTKKIFLVDELGEDIAEFLSSIKKEIKLFNERFARNQAAMSTLTGYELSMLAGDLMALIFMPKIPFVPYNRKIATLKTIYKLWKNKDKIKATILRLNNAA